MNAEALRYYRALTPIVASAVAGVASYRLVSAVAGPSLRRASTGFRDWCRATSARLGLRARLRGAASPIACVYLANHRSYLDVPLLGGLLEGSFLSRADIAAWPVIGFAARELGTVFLDREDPRSGARAARALSRCLRSRSVIVFPEGTTGGDRLPRPFAPGLFRLLGRRDVPLVPVTIRYGDRRVYWTEALPIGAHLRTRVLPAGPLPAAVHLGAPLRAAQFGTHEALAAAAYAAVCAPIEAFGELSRMDE